MDFRISIKAVHEEVKLGSSWSVWLLCEKQIPRHSLSVGPGRHFPLVFPHAEDTEHTHESVRELGRAGAQGPRYSVSGPFLYAVLSLIELNGGIPH